MCSLLGSVWSSPKDLICTVRGVELELKGLYEGFVDQETLY